MPLNVMIKDELILASAQVCTQTSVGIDARCAVQLILMVDELLKKSTWKLHHNFSAKV